ncbi:DEAD/DEAH box helicase [Sedimentimonas flavescens]|uniref:DEAD/DEAH box helicase n=1 Tax=Sedimentimonas flavescens TaxID=2851012 RepID=UPI001C49F103|nr:DEAD/DEAH box helicase [Sedimentimonas flavescens]MBW0159683.1 DEAD/DEAH box helicase [Sedimentimonas flavescens]
MSKSVPSVSVRYAQTGTDQKSNELGMRPMQERAFERRGEQYLLIKSPPASGKSRALMFIALDKLENQGCKQAIVVVPEKSIGASFNNEPLTKFGFWADWYVAPRCNLCNAPGGDSGKVDAVGTFLASSDKVLVCTHATFRFAVDKFGIEVFDDRLIAVDEFHHVSANPENKLGAQLTALIARGSAHIVAMTGSYFRGDAEAVLSPDDEGKFDTVTYTYYEQLNGYRWLKQLDIGYFFYTGPYADDILNVLDPNEKTIIHIPSVNARESTKDKHKEVEHIIDALGEWEGVDEATGFQLVKSATGRVLKIADLVDDTDMGRRNKVLNSLKDPTRKNNRDHVDIIIALGMAKEGFDWIWCEHALTVGYRASLTEIVQIIGRATRDAENKTKARFTNLIAEPDAASDAVAEAVNDTLKAIAASLLMEQVLAPKFDFVPKTASSGPVEGVDYGPNGYDYSQTNVGMSDNPQKPYQIEIKGLITPSSEKAQKACEDDINDIVASFVADRATVAKGIFTPADDLVTEEITQLKMGKVIRDRYPDLDDTDHEAIRQRAVAALNLTQKAAEAVRKLQDDPSQPSANTALIDGVRKFAMDVRELDIDMIDSINPFGEAYSILAKSMSEENLKQVAHIIAGKKASLSIDEARELAGRALRFKADRGRLPSITAADPWERRMAEGIAFLQRKTAEMKHG